MIALGKLGRPRVLIVGCGDIGMRCVALLRHRCRVFALTSQHAHRAELRAAGALPLVADLDRRRSLQRLAGLAPQIVHLAPPPANGSDDPRTRALLAALARRRRGTRHRPPASRGQRPPANLSHRSPAFRRATIRAVKAAPIVPEPGVPESSGRRNSSAAIGGAGGGSRRPLARRYTLIYASTTGVYGDCGGALVAETRPVQPANPRAVRRVAAEARLRRAGAAGWLRAGILRVPGIYAGDRLPLERLRRGTPALLAAQDVYTGHIHADDLAAIMVGALTRARPQRITHAVDDTRLKMGDYFDRVARAFGLPAPRRISRSEAEQQLAPTLLSFMRESRRLLNQRLKDELRYRLRYPSVEVFLGALLNAQPETPPRR